MKFFLIVMIFGISVTMTSGGLRRLCRYRSFGKNGVMYSRTHLAYITSKLASSRSTVRRIILSRIICTNNCSKPCNRWMLNGRCPCCVNFLYISNQIRKWRKRITGKDFIPSKWMKHLFKWVRGPSLPVPSCIKSDTPGIEGFTVSLADLLGSNLCLRSTATVYATLLVAL